MKYIITIILLLLATSIKASSLDCYDGKVKIYHGESKAIIVYPKAIIVPHKRYDEVIYRKNKTNPNCVISQIIK